MITAADILELGAEIIREGGLCKGAYENDRGEHCVLGALRDATYVARRRGHQLGEIIFAHVGAGLALTSLLDPEGTLAPLGVTSFNDAPDTTAEMVVDKLLETAKDLRNKS